MSRLCVGSDVDTPCFFDWRVPGRRARVHGDQQQCQFCNLDLLEDTINTVSGRRAVIAQLRRIHAQDEAVFYVAVARVGEVSADTAEIEELAKRPPKAGRAATSVWSRGHGDGESRPRARSRSPRRRADDVAAARFDETLVDMASIDGVVPIPWQQLPPPSQAPRRHEAAPSDANAPASYRSQAGRRPDIDSTTSTASRVRRARSGHEQPRPITPSLHRDHTRAPSTSSAVVEVPWAKVFGQTTRPASEPPAAQQSKRPGGDGRPASQAGVDDARRRAARKTSTVGAAATRWRRNRVCYKRRVVPEVPRVEPVARPRLCLGLDARTPCIFSQRTRGKAAEPLGDLQTCCFCDWDVLDESLSTPAGRSLVIGKLRWLCRYHAPALFLGLVRIGEISPDLAEVEELALRCSKVTVPSVATTAEVSPESAPMRP